MITDFFIQLPTWWMIRISGLGSYYILFVGICLGIVHSMPVFRGKWKRRLNDIHKYAVGTGLVVGLLHGMILMVDTFMPYSLKEIFIPFTSANQPFWNGLGTLALYGLLLIALTTDLKRKLGKKTWHGFHLLAYPVFILTMLHGIALGTDTHVTWVTYSYSFTAGTVIALTGIRIMVKDSHRAPHRAASSNHGAHHRLNAPSTQGEFPTRRR